jgi:ribonucleoside-diphosphate reductase beta chain
MRNIFSKRASYKPFEYPDIIDFRKAIHQSFWTADEINFLADKHDYYVNLTPVQRSVIKNTLLAISQIEVKVKDFWGDIGDRFPKAEFKEVGAAFADSEVRHANAYAQLLEVLDLNGEFSLLLDNPVIQGRDNYLAKYLTGAASHSNERYALTLALFSLFVENVSLFSQFAIIKSFCKHGGYMKDVDNIVDATSKEETIHALFGVKLLKLIQGENPDWFNADFYKKLTRVCDKAFVAECGIIDWIFTEGELEFISKDTLKEFIKHRFNESLGMVGAPTIFEVDPIKLEPIKWFMQELLAETSTDFFHKRPTTYSKRTVAASDLFRPDNDPALGNTFNV